MKSLEASFLLLLIVVSVIIMIALLDIHDFTDYDTLYAHFA